MSRNHCTYNHGHNILRLFHVSPNSPFTTSETKGDYKHGTYELPNHLRLRMLRNKETARSMSVVYP